MSIPSVIKTSSLRLPPPNVRRHREVVLPTPAMIAAAEQVLAARAKAAATADETATAPDRPAKALGRPRAAGGLSDRAVTVLALLAAAPGGLTRKQLAVRTGVQKGWSALLGAPTKGSPGGLEGAGLVKSTTAGDGVYTYTITAKGRKSIS